jgi:hypothetical protein
VDNRVLINRYEQLRCQALGKLLPGGHGLGRALFIQKGMVAWTQAWSEHAGEVKTGNNQVLNISILVPENISGQITTVLTNMIMDLN